MRLDLARVRAARAGCSEYLLTALVCVVSLLLVRSFAFDWFFYFIFFFFNNVFEGAHLFFPNRHYFASTLSLTALTPFAPFPILSIDSQMGEVAEVT